VFSQSEVAITLRLVGFSEGERDSYSVLRHSTRRPAKMKYEFVTTEQVKQAFTSDVKAEIEVAAKELVSYASRELRLDVLPGLKLQLCDETLDFLHISSRQEEQHKDLMHSIMMENTKTASRYSHDHTKDDLFLFVVPASFAGATGPAMSQLRQEELRRHHQMEAHHPEYEHCNPGKQCDEDDIFEMAVDRLARNAQFGDGTVRAHEVVQQFMPVFATDNVMKQSLFWRYVHENSGNVQKAFDRMFGVKQFELGGGRMLRLKTWHGHKIVDIREWTPEMPTKRGAIFPFKRYVSFRDSMERIDEALRDVKNKKIVSFKAHFGGNVYATVQTPYACVNIRQWYLENDVLKPGRGTSLRSAEWNELLRIDRELLDTVEPEIKTTLRCYEQLDHQNQEGAMDCCECNPNGVYTEEIPLLGFN